MRSILNGLILIWVAVFTSNPAFASTAKDVIRGNAKFNVVIVVLLVIFLGISLYLFRLDRRIGRMEQNEKKD